ncbi:unnamed protein product [Arctia plantaginis]|uniref:Hexamerin n=1 Tax=Arctia plantaginis TaxID=874455 RepID=A0A8S1B4F5_ARCPL|nr:unnamed protein product [Arctia plantaginis]
MKPETVKSLQNLIASGLLVKGEIFSEYNITHMNELKIIYDVLFNAKDFDTFYKTAAWARQNLNCALYVNALYMAIQHRKDTEILSIPAPYELLPNYFIDQYVIIQAAKFFEKDYSNLVVRNETIHNEGNSYIIDANYTGLFYDNDDESKLAYFREDVGLNSYYYLMKLRMAPWFNDNVNDKFGENMFQMMKQFIARYNLERYANGLPAVDSITWDTPVNVPYNPMLMYSNGVEFGHRTSSIELSENENVQQLQTIENNIAAVVDHLHQRGYNKTHILNHLMEIMVTGDKSYETLARKLLGKNAPNNGQTSVLDHYMTSLRDPIFWNINTKIVTIVDEALKLLPTYTKNELFFPGVEIINIDVKKIITAYDYFTLDVTDALKTEETGFRIKIGQPRLNHKQFTLKVNISSLVSQKGMMKIYLGPQIMPGELAIKKHLFMLLDICQVNLKVGTNIITRTPENMDLFSEDFNMLNTLQKNVENAEFGLDSLPPKTILSQVGFPSRLMLPKGTAQGLPLQLFVFIAPYIKAGIDESYSTNNFKFNTAILSPGYPLDLNIQDQQLFQLPNALIKYITVVQKGEGKVENYGGPGITRSWYITNTYDSSARPNYPTKNQQYGNKKEYSSKSYEIRDTLNDFKSDQENIESDYNTIYREHNESNLRMNYKGNNYSPKREPYDYKAKKAEYEKKDYAAKRNFTKYHTITNNENNIVESTTATDIISSSENDLYDIFNNLLPKKSYQENDTRNETEIAKTRNTQEDFSGYAVTSSISNA